MILIRKKTTWFSINKHDFDTKTDVCSMLVHMNCSSILRASWFNSTKKSIFLRQQGVVVLNQDCDNDVEDMHCSSVRDGSVR